MSQKAYLICNDTREILCLGKVLRDDSGRATDFWYNRAEVGAVQNAAFRFLLDHAGKKCQFITDQVLWDMELGGFVWADAEYGLPHRGRRELDSEGMGTTEQ